MATKSYEPTSSIGQRLTRVQALKLEIDQLTQQLDQEKAYLLGHLVRNDLESVKCGAVTVSRRARATWFFSDSIKQAERRLKDRKQVEQDKGIATCQLSEHAVVSFSAHVALAQLQEVR